MLLFVSHLIPLSTMASLSHHISHGGLFWRGSWVWRGGEIREVRLAWYGGDFWVYFGTFFGFMDMQRRDMVVCGGMFMGFRRGLQR